MRNSKNLLSLLALLLGLGLMVASGGKVEKEALLTPTYNYDAPKYLEKEGTKMTFALMSPSFGQEFSSNNTELSKVQGEPFKSFNKGLEGEIEEVLTTKGFGIRGPFRDVDEMIYSDKEQSEFAISIQISPELMIKSGDWKGVKTSSGKMGAQFKKGTVTIYGDIVLTAFEPISGEKMWTKRVNIPEKTTREFTSSMIYTGSTSSNAVALFTLATADPNVSNPLTEALQAAFPEIMDQVWRHLDPAEFKRLLPKVKELKEKG